MSNTNAHTNAVESGSQPMMPQLKPWEIADLPLFRFVNGQIISVESATDEQFAAWVRHNALPVKSAVGASWDFDNRCKLINHTRYFGAYDALKLPVDFSAVDEENTDG